MFNFRFQQSMVWSNGKSISHSCLCKKSAKISKTSSQTILNGRSTNTIFHLNCWSYHVICCIFDGEIYGISRKKWKITAFLWTIWYLKYKKKQFSVSSCKRSENSIRFNRQISRIIGNWKVFILYVLVCANPSLFYVKRLIMKYYFIWNAACDPK